MAVSRCIVSHKENEAHELRGSASYTCDTLRPYLHALHTTLPSPHHGKYVLMTSCQYYVIYLIKIYKGIWEKFNVRRTSPQERYKQLITNTGRLRCPRILRILTCPQKYQEPVLKTIRYKLKKRMKICHQIRKGRM